MKNAILSFIILLLFQKANAQVGISGSLPQKKDTAQTVAILKPALTDSIQRICDSVQYRRNRLIKNNMIILGAWSGLNIIQSGISATNTSGATQAFLKMNVYWNIANAAIAGWGLWQVKKKMAEKLSFRNNWLEQNKLEKLLLFNTGLDVGYITTGLFLNEKGQRSGNPQTEGYGTGIIVQGSFLLILDLVQYFEHRHNGKQLNKIDFGPTGNGVGLSVHF
ncbi:MAG: hypothetical protein KGO81_10555 [Bacteroidota bacterium]|nr:hypothetical protein [Bacteroidota bacterium]